MKQVISSSYLQEFGRAQKNLHFVEEPRLCGRTWAFPPGRWEPWRAVGRGGARPDPGAHRPSSGPQLIFNTYEAKLRFMSKKKKEVVF